MQGSDGNAPTMGEAVVLNKNPFRYRGYHYDSETGFYYLESRYYDPEICRFISPDDPTNLYLTAGTAFGANLYAYCLNNPVMWTDNSGEFVDAIWDVISLFISIGDMLNNPSLENIGWVAIDALCSLIPFVPAIGGGLKIVKGVDDIIDVGKGIHQLVDIRHATKADFTKEAWNLVKGLDRSGGFTKSSMSLGRRIHKGFMNNGRGAWINLANRPDGFSRIGKTIFELKPNNARGIRQGLKQLDRYRRAAEGEGLGVLKYVLVLY